MCEFNFSNSKFIYDSYHFSVNRKDIERENVCLITFVRNIQTGQIDITYGIIIK